MILCGPIDSVAAAVVKAKSIARAFCTTPKEGLPGSSAFYILQDSGAARAPGKAASKKPADELRLAGGSGLRQNAVRVAARRRLGDFEPRGGGEKPVSTNDFRKNACFGNGQPESCGKALNLGAKAGGGIDDEDGRGRPVDIEDRRRAAGGERDDMGEKRRAILPQLSSRVPPISPSLRPGGDPARASACRRWVSVGVAAASCPRSYRKLV
jgi:hypothetical protein